MEQFVTRSGRIWAALRPLITVVAALPAVGVGSVLGQVPQSGTVSRVLIIGGSPDDPETRWFEGTVDFDPGSGVFNLSDGGGKDAFVLKLDNSGDFIWAK